MRRRVGQWLPVVLLGLLVTITAGSVGTPVAADGRSATGPSDVTSGVTPIDSCTTISEPGRYALTEDIENGGGTLLSRACIRIDAGDVVLDGDGHRVDGNGVSNTTGIAVTAADARNVTVTDLEVRDWHRGIDYRKSTCGRISTVTATNNTYGLSLERAAGIRVADSEPRGNIVGVETVRWVNRLSGVQAQRNQGTDVHRGFPSLRQLVAWTRC
ncbi:hypothetical protein [Haloprofundus halophilus]|uniref:hypothetical protein n=1 Tax=Haloprofundus halophilus TaxID=2283527 RepID=UPI000E446CBB|nr:hypothetical protein [Haloprofundus halophilus]